MQTTVSRKGCITETNYQYSIISPHILVAKPNQQKGGGVISSEYGTRMPVAQISHFQNLYWGAINDVSCACDCVNLLVQLAFSE